MISSWYALTAGVISADAAGAGAGAEEEEDGGAECPAIASCEAEVGDLSDVVGAGDDWVEATSSSREVTADESQLRVVSQIPKLK